MPYSHKTESPVFYKIIRSAILFVLTFISGEEFGKSDFVSLSPRQKLSVFFLFSTFLILLAVPLFYVVSGINRESTFNATSTTEITTINTEDHNRSPWAMDDMKVKLSCFDDNQPFSFSGTLNISNDVEISIIRIYKSDVHIVLRSKDNSSVGTLYDEEDEPHKSLANCAEIIVHDIDVRARSGRSVIFPITGEIRAGGLIRHSAFQNVPVLTDGSVTILDREIFTKEQYSVGPFELNTGDVFEISNKSTPSQGVVIINSDPGMKLVFMGKSDSGRIIRYMSDGYEIKNGFFNRVYSDEGLGLLLVLLIGAIGFFRAALRSLLK